MQARQQGMHVPADQLLIKLMRLTNPGRLQAFRDRVSSTTSAVGAEGVTGAANSSQQRAVAPVFSNAAAAAALAREQRKQKLMS